MEAEVLMVVLAAFVGGGAMGATGMLLTQWVVRKMSPPPQPRGALMDPRDLEVMKADVADLAVRLHSVDARLDFTEQLLGGALSVAHPPAPLPAAQTLPGQAAPEAARGDPAGEAAGGAEEEAGPENVPLDAAASLDGEAQLGEPALPEEEAPRAGDAPLEQATGSPEAIQDSSEQEDAFGA